LVAWLGEEPPLLELRRRQGLRVDTVVERLGAAHKLGMPAQRQTWERQRQAPALHRTATLDD